jgi:hypothetical protein
MNGHRDLARFLPCVAESLLLLLMNRLAKRRMHLWVADARAKRVPAFGRLLAMRRAHG